MLERAAFEPEFRRLEESLWRPETRFDLSWMEQVLHPDFTEIGRSGRHWSRAEVLSMAARPIAVVLPLPDFHAALLGQAVALTIYRTLGRAESDLSALRSSVWVRREGAWILRFHQGTALQ